MSILRTVKENYGLLIGYSVEFPLYFVLNAKKKIQCVNKKLYKTELYIIWSWTILGRMTWFVEILSPMLYLIGMC